MQNDNRCPGTDNHDYPRFYSELYNCDIGFPQPLLLSEVHYQFVEGKQNTISSTSYNYKKVVKDDFPVGVRVSKDDVEVVYFSNQAGDTYVPYPSRAEFVNSFHYHDVYAIPTFYRASPPSITKSVSKSPSHISMTTTIEVSSLRL